MTIFNTKGLAIGGVQVGAAFDSIAALRLNNQPAAVLNTCSVTAYYGGSAVALQQPPFQGSYFVKTNDTTSADNGGSIIVDAAGNRWYLSNSSVVTVQQFGVFTTNVAAQNDTCMNSALNSGIKTLKIPNSGSGVYSFSAYWQITAASVGVSVIGEDKQNTICSWTINIGAGNKFATLLDGFVTIENLTLQNLGSDRVNPCGIVSYTPTLGNGFHNGRLKNVRLKGWAYGIGSSSDGVTVTQVLSNCFSNVFDSVEFNDCGTPIYLGAGTNNNVWIKPEFLNTYGNRHINLNNCSTNLFISPTFEPFAASVTTGALNAYLLQCSNTVFLNPYFEPCYGILADSSPGTVVDSPLVEGFDFVVGNLTNNSLLRSTAASNAGVFQYPIVSSVRLAVCRAATNPVSYVASDDDANTLTLVDTFTSRDSNFKLKPSGQKSKLAINTEGTWVPTIIGSSGGGAGNVYSQQYGYWIRAGNMVTAFFRVALSAKDAALAGNVQIAGLPFNIANLTFYAPSAVFSETLATLSAGNTMFLGEGTANTSLISLIQTGTGIPASFLPVANIGATAIFVGQITYMTDAA